MARKNANSAPGVWLGLLLVLVAHTVAQSTHGEDILKYEGYQKNDENAKDSSVVFPEVGPPPKRWTLHDGQKGKKDTEDLSDGKWIEENSAISKSESYHGPGGTLEKSNVDKDTPTMKTRQEHTTLGENVAAPTKATIENVKMASESREVDIPLNRTIESVAKVGEITSEKELPVTSFQEFEAAGEDDNFEEHTSSELAEATTPSSKFSGSDREKVPHDSRKNIEATNIQQSDNRDAGNNNTISFVNDTKVNEHFGNGTRKFDENAEIFKHLTTYPSSLRIIGVTVGDTDNTTTYSSNSSKAKDRTISITGDNDLSTKEPKNNSYSDVNRSTSDTKSRILPKKSTEKPYPYFKSESKFNDDEFVSENQNTTAEETVKEVSSYENTIGRQISDETTIVTEPSVLVENSIQQTKPIHPKRSGNQSRINATLHDIPVTSASWSLTTTANLASKNGTDVSQSPRTSMSDNESRSEIESDAPQDNPIQSVSTERPPAVLSDETENNIETAIGKNNLTASTPISKKLTERSEIIDGVTAGNISKLADTPIPNSTEKIITDSNRSSTGNDIEILNGDSSITLNESNVTEGLAGYPHLRGNFSTSTENYYAGTSNATEKSISQMETTVSLPLSISMTTESIQETSSEIIPFESTEATPIEKNATNVTRLETTSGSSEITKTIPETTSSQTTNVEYEFVELTTRGVISTSSQVDIASSEKIDTTITDFLNETSQTTESQETVITESSIEPNNETTVSNKIATVDDFETPTPSTTMIFDTTTTSEMNSEVTTEEDTSKTTSFPMSDTSITTVTDDYTDMTLSLTSFNDNSSNGRLDVTTTVQSYNPEEMTTTTTRLTEPELPIEETTTISNIEVLSSSESTSTSQTFTTVTQRTTVRVQSTSEPPEFTTSSDDVTLFVRVLIEGSWSDICPVLGDLRQSLANLLTVGTDRTILSRNIILHQTQCSAERTRRTTLTPVALYVVDDKGDFDYTMTEILPSLYKNSAFSFPLMIHSVEKLVQTEPSNNAIAVVAVSSVAFICLVLLAGLLFIMRKRQTRFNYGERCRPVSLDAFRVDSVSAYNSVRRKGLTRASKRSYGNPAFEDSSVTPSHPLNFAGLSSFCNDINAITEEFEGIPQVTARMDELPAGSEVKNRYANVAPLPETRVLLQKINNEPLTEYINASYVRGPKNATKYYIACQAPMESTVSDFWRMIWEQQSKVIIMLTDIIENGVEKCVEYIPPSEVTDCHRLYGDYQVTLKKREAKEKYAISTLHLKNLENNTYREVSHIWYLWPTNGVPSNGTGLIAILLEARALQRGAPGPIVVHCSPGTGRTGTLIALDLGIRQYEITRTIDVPRVVYTIRRDRAGAVQTKEQYAFIYKALNLYAAKLAGGALESM